MTGDIEILKTIRERETAVERELQELQRQKEEELEILKKALQSKVEEVKLKADSEYKAAIEKKRHEVLEKCNSIIEEAKRKADGIKLKIPAKEIEKMVSNLILEYLGE